jgi:hypothetical protein
MTNRVVIISTSVTGAAFDLATMYAVMGLPTSIWLSKPPNKGQTRSLEQLQEFGAQIVIGYPQLPALLISATQVISV